MSKVVLNKDNGIAILSINRPEGLNALSREIVDEIGEAVETVKADSEIQVLILHSEKNFAAGADIKKMCDCTEEEAAKFIFTDTFNKIDELEIPTIAAIEGYALGGGLELALTCDLRISAVGAKMGFPETGLGIMPGAGGTVRTPQLVGKSKSLELIMMGTVISAQEAHRIGLINSVVEEGCSKDEAVKWAQKIMKKGPVAVRTAKRTVKQAMKEPDSRKATAIEQNNWVKLFNTEDQKEGMKAFIEKRKPEYKGR